MTALQRSTVVARGARFFERDGELMFEFVMDGSTRFGPRPATDADREQYPEAFARLGEEPAINPPPVTFLEPEEEEPAPRRRRA